MLLKRKISFIHLQEQQPTDLETYLPDQLTRREELIDELSQSQRFSSLILAQDVEDNERYVMTWFCKIS